MLFLLFSGLININGPWPPSFSWEEVSLPFNAIVGIRVGPTSNLGMLLSQARSCRTELGMPMSVWQRPWTLCKGLWSQWNTGVPGPALLPLGSCSAEFVALDLPLFFFVLFFIPAHCTCTFTSISMTCPSTFCDDLSLDSHSSPLLSLPTQEASLILLPELLRKQLRKHL